MKHRWIAGLCLLFMCLQSSAGAQERRISNRSNTYSFAVTSDWSLANPDFMLTTGYGASLQESDIPPQKNPSLTQISKTAGMIALIGADYASTDDSFTIFGENWEGLVTVFIEPRRTGKTGRHVLQLVARHGNSYRLFYLSLPSALWRTERDRFTGLLSALKFH